MGDARLVARIAFELLDWGNLLGGAIHWWFASCLAPQVGPLAQMVEHRTFNPWVEGSSPSGPTDRSPSSTGRRGLFVRPRRSARA